MTRRILATIEARMTSSRLPGKVLLPAAGKPLLAHMVERLRDVPTLDGIVIATTTNATDDPLVALAAELNVLSFRGSEDDVLTRVLGAARHHGADVIVETTGDCPAIDPEICEHVIQTYLNGPWDYVSNVLEITYPIGMDVQVFSTDVLADTATRTHDPLDHEHVSLFIYRHPELYSLYNVAAPDALRAPHLEITLDTEADYQLIRTIFDKLYPENPAFRLPDILSFLHAQPDLIELIRDVERRHV